MMSKHIPKMTQLVEHIVFRLIRDSKGLTTDQPIPFRAWTPADQTSI